MALLLPAVPEVNTVVALSAFRRYKDSKSHPMLSGWLVVNSSVVSMQPGYPACRTRSFASSGYPDFALSVSSLSKP